MTQDDTGRTFEWDAVNRMVAINSGTHRSEFTYNGIGQRVKIVEKDSSITASSKYFIWDGMVLREEQDGNGVVVQRFTKFEVQLAGSSFYADKDHLNSSREFTDASGNLQSQYNFDAWGNRLKIAGTRDFDVGFTNHYFNVESGLWVTTFRYYIAKVGRWLSRDPLSNAEFFKKVRTFIGTFRIV